MICKPRAVQKYKNRSTQQNCNNLHLNDDIFIQNLTTPRMNSTNSNSLHGEKYPIITRRTIQIKTGATQFVLYHASISREHIVKYRTPLVLNKARELLR